MQILTAQSACSIASSMAIARWCNNATKWVWRPRLIPPYLSPDSLKDEQGQK